MKPKYPRFLKSRAHQRFSTPTLGIILAVSSLALQSAHADATWVGDTSQDWNTAANWSSDPANPAGNFIINNATVGVHPIIGSSSSFTPVDVFIGDGVAATGRLDHRIGALSLANVTASGNWYIVGRNSGTGTYNLADTAGTGGTLTGFATGTGSLTVGKLWVGGAKWGGIGTGTVKINTTGSITANSTAESTSDSAAPVILGMGAGSTGTINLDNGILQANGNMFIGNGGSGTINQSGGTVNATGTLFLARQVGTTGTGSYVMTGGTVNAGLVEVGYGVSNTGTQQGTLTLGTGATFNSESDFRTGFAGSATSQATVNVNGGILNIASTTKRWMIVGWWDSANSTINVNSGSLNLNTNTDIRVKHKNAGGANIINLNGGAITSFSDNKTTPNGAGVVDLMTVASTATNTLNLNSGTLTIREVMTSNDGGTATVNLNGGILKATGATANFLTLGGANQKAVVKTGGAKIDSNTFDVTIAQALLHDATLGATADGGLTKSSTGNLTLSGVNDYTGNTTINDGTLTLADNARLKFVLGTTGVNNKITGTGTVQLSGDFTLDTTAAGTTPGNSWQIVDVGTLTETYGPTFTVVGGSQIGSGVWLVGSYRFTQATGIVDFLADTDTDGLPDEWEMDFFGDLDETGTTNPDGDISTNAQELLAGSNPTNILSTHTDIDADALLDAWEIVHFGSIIATNDSATDLDGDGFTNAQESAGTTDPYLSSSYPGSTVVYLTADDIIGASGFNGATTWTNSLAPLAGNTYATRDFLLRTPADAASYTFAGDSLTIDAKGNNFVTGGDLSDTLIYKGTGTTGTITVNNLTVNGGYLRQGSTAGDTFRLAGNLTVGKLGAGFQSQGPLVVDSAIHGTGPIYITGNGTNVVTFASGSNDYTGTITLLNSVDARLRLADTGKLKFVLGAAGVNNRITSSGTLGTLALDGTFEIDVTAASTTAHDTWTIVDATKLAETYGTTFSVSGWSEITSASWASGIWESADHQYRFNKATGQVERQSDSDADGLDDAWEIAKFTTLSAQTGANDPDVDLLTNAAEQILGTDPTLANPDSDGLDDYQEITGVLNTGYGNAPTDPNDSDSDNDGLNDGAEITANSNPHDPDTDDDGLTDTQEVAAGSDPRYADTDFDSWNDFQEVNLGTGPDESGSYPALPTWSVALISNTLRNGSFELLTVGGVPTSGLTARASHWDADPDGDITDWSLWAAESTANNDSGSEVALPNSPNWTQGTRVGLWQPGNASCNMTNHTAAEGDLFYATWNTTGFSYNAQISSVTAWLVYDVDGVPTKIDFAKDTTTFSTTTLQTGRLVYKIPAGSPAIGKKIGLGIKNTSTWYASLDQVSFGVVVAGSDTDGDGLPDLYEDQYFGNNSGTIEAGELDIAKGDNTQTGLPGAGNSDADIYSNLAEFAAGSNPTVAGSVPGDIDADTMSDLWEDQYFGDNDGIALPAELALRNGSADSDGDYATDLQEFTASSDPTYYLSFPDADTDSMSDQWEEHFFTTITSTDGTSDEDGDTLSSLNEFTNKTDPKNPLSPGTADGDIDNDGLPDRWEVATFDATNLATQNGSGDYDGDLASNLAEYQATSDPKNNTKTPTDINGDGTSDTHVFIGMDALGSGILDKDSQAIPFTDRLANTGTAIASPDTQLDIDTTAGTLALTSATSDINGQVNMAGLEAIGIPLSSLGFTGNEDFRIRARYINQPVLGGFDQIGAYVGTSSTQMTRASVIGTLHPSLGVNTNGTSDSDPFFGAAGSAGAAGTDLTVIIERVSGVWSMTCNGNTCTALAQPAFLNGLATLQAGVFALDGGSGGTHKTATLDSFTAVSFGVPSANPDTDADGMEDAWETTWFGGLTQGPADDFDADGTNNLTEYRLGLTPNSGTSRFALTRNSATGLLTWPSAGGLTFRIERSTTLESWTVLDAAYPAAASPATTTTYTDAAPPVGKSFYRIGLNP